MVSRNKKVNSMSADDFRRQQAAIQQQLQMAAAQQQQIAVIDGFDPTEFQAREGWCLLEKVADLFVVRSVGPGEHTLLGKRIQPDLNVGDECFPFIAGDAIQFQSPVKVTGDLRRFVLSRCVQVVGRKVAT